MTDKTATERLREMLDERGELYTTNDEMGCCETSWRGFTVYQLTPGSKLVTHPTPEQAIAATLGSGTCGMYRDEEGVWHCKACEAGADKDTGSDGVLDCWDDSWPPNYCPNCGRKVVNE